MQGLQLLLPYLLEAQDYASKQECAEHTRQEKRVFL